MSLIRRMTRKQRVAPNAPDFADRRQPVARSDAERLQQMVVLARTQLKDLAERDTFQKVNQWFGKNGDLDGGGITIRIGRVPLDVAGKVSPEQSAKFHGEAQLTCDGLMSSNINASVISALLLAAEIPLIIVQVVFATGKDAVQDSMDDPFPADIVFDDFASYVRPTDPMSVRRPFMIAESIILALSVLLAFLALFMSLVNCQIIATFPSPVMTMHFFLHHVSAFGVAQFGWVGSLQTLAFALPFTAAKFSAIGGIAMMSMAILYMLVGFLWLGAPWGPVEDAYFMMRDEARNVLLEIKSEADSSTSDAAPSATMVAASSAGPEGE